MVAISQSFMTNQEVNRWPPKVIPTEPTLDNIHTVLTQQDLRLDLWLRNSLIAATGYTVAVLVICSPAAYAFARLRFPGNNALFRSEEHTSELQSRENLVCRLLL